MNNIYVDKLPDCCGNCSLCCKDDLGYWCQATRLVYIDERFVDEKILKSCPLKLLSTRLTEERKKVVQEIKTWLKQDGFEADDFEELFEKIERNDV